MIPFEINDLYQNNVNTAAAAAVVQVTHGRLLTSWPERCGYWVMWSGRLWNPVMKSAAQLCLCVTLRYIP